MTTIRRILVLALTACALFLVGTFHGVTPDAAWAGTPPLVSRTAEGLVLTLAWAAEHPRAALILLAVVTVPVLLGRLVALIPRAVQKDPIRMFTSDQRRSGFDLAGGRCEMDGLLLTRCRAPAAHGDHWFPWSKGGPTSMENFVAACVSHNCAKGSKVPTFWQTQRLAWRRRRYFPAERLHALTPGGKFEARRR